MTLPYVREPAWVRLLAEAQLLGASDAQIDRAKTNARTTALSLTDELRTLIYDLKRGETEEAVP